MEKKSNELSMGWAICIAPFLYAFLGCLGIIHDVGNFDRQHPEKWN